MTPDDLEPLDPDESALRTLDDHARAAAEGLRRATAVAPPPLRSQRVGIRPGATIEVGHPTFTLGGPRVRKSRIIVALAVAALIATAVAVVTRSRTSHQSPATTVTTAPPATTEAPTTVCIPGITPDVMADIQVVHLVARGCAPGVTYLVAECALNGASAGQALRGGGAGPYLGSDPLGDCLRQSVMADVTGTVSTDFKVQRVFPWVDCGVAPGCVVTLNLPDGNRWSSISGVGVYQWESGAYAG